MIPLQDTSIVNKLPVIQEELLQLEDVLAVTTSQSIPGLAVGINLMRAEQPEGMSEQTFNVMRVGHGYLKTLEMQIIEGRSFDENFSSDDTAAFIINERLAKKMGWDDPIGKRLQLGVNLDGTAQRDGKVIAMVKDFNIKSLHNTIEPTVIVLKQQKGGMLQLRISGDNIPVAMERIEDKWSEFDPNRPFSSFFLDDRLNELYESDQRQSKLIGILTLLCVLISCLGLFGLAAYSTEQRVKEIGIRKVLGASVSQIVRLIFKDILLLIVIATVIAAPLSYFVIADWLESFAFKAPVAVLPFIYSAVMSIVIAAGTVGYHSLVAANANPIKALKYE